MALSIGRSLRAAVPAFRRPGVQRWPGFPGAPPARGVDAVAPDQVLPLGGMVNVNSSTSPLRLHGGRSGEARSGFLKIDWNRRQGNAGVLDCQLMEGGGIEIPRQKGGKSIGRSFWQPCQDVPQGEIGFQAIQFDGLDQGVEIGACGGSARASCCHPIVSTNRKRPN